MKDKSVLLAGKELTGDIMAQVGHATTQLGKQRVEKFKKFIKGKNITVDRWEGWEGIEKFVMIIVKK